MMGSAVISPDGRYRYALIREWHAPENVEAPTVALFVMLNPSTADATTDDPTIRRCIGFARREHCTRLVVVNLFAFRSVDPVIMKAAARAGVDIVGPANDAAVRELATGADLVVCAWGAVSMGKAGAARIEQTLQLLREARAELTCLGTTANGSPRHPLYVRGDAPLLPYRRSEMMI